MDEGRKYRHRGYMDSYQEEERRERKPEPKSRRPGDMTGPKLPRMVQAVAASRCHNCSVVLPRGTDFSGNCPKCNAPLHCCKQCAYFEPSVRFECLKPIPKRIGSKDKPNDCQFFTPRITVARETTQRSSRISPSLSAAPKDAKDAREMFERLFRK